MKKLVGIYDFSGVLLGKRPILVSPVYFDGKNYFFKCMSENLNNLLKILKGLKTQEDIHEEIDAYINKENSLFSVKTIRYTDDSNYCYQLCSNSIRNLSGFHSIDSFPEVQREAMKETYQTNTYAAIDYGERLFVGSLDYIKRHVEEVSNVDMTKLFEEEELIKKVNNLVSINRYFEQFL